MWQVPSRGFFGALLKGFVKIVSLVHRKCNEASDKLKSVHVNNAWRAAI